MAVSDGIVHRVAALVLCWGAPAAVAQNTSEVSFHVVSQKGTPVSFEVRSFRTRIRGDEFADRFHGLSARDIPFGTYEYELRSVPDGVFKVSSSIAVLEPEVFLPLADIKPVLTMDGKVVYPAFERPKGYSRSLRISGVEIPEGVAWVRLDAVFGQKGLHLRLNRRGEGRLFEQIMGPFVATVVGGQAVSAQVIDAGHERSVEPIVIAVQPAKQASRH